MLFLFVQSYYLSIFISRTVGREISHSLNFHSVIGVCFFIFLIEEIIILGVMSLCACLGFRINKNRDKEILAQWEADKYSGIEPGDYDYVWVDFANTDRALILKQGDTFRLNVQEYDYNTGNWESVGTSIYDNLEAIKEALFYEYDFYCEENAELDKHGDEIYKET